MLPRHGVLCRVIVPDGALKCVVATLDGLMELLAQPEVSPLINGMILCSLVSEYNPNQRYVAQYGVQRAPAVILVHRDGTYHTRTGPMSTDQIVQFLANDIPTNTYLNLMDQYRPAYKAHQYPEINRPITHEEYQAAVQMALDADINRLDQRRARSWRLF